MNNKQYRLRELLKPSDERSLVVDTSNGLVMGTLPGLEHFTEAVKPLLRMIDGVVTSPGQARNLGMRTRQEAALLVRADWTNALRDEDFVLPPEIIQYIPILDPEDALDLGANALVMHFILGHSEEIESQCLQRVVHLALEGLKVGMPLIVDVKPIGPRVVLRSKAIELGVSYAIEGGADGIVVPWPGTKSFETILGMTSGMPVWVRPDSLETEAIEVNDALRMGAVGLWLDERLFAEAEPAVRLQELRNIVHVSEAV
jgi:DhnA family fructose-bisphosphate aldolase class Ia